MRISDWSSDVCSSDLRRLPRQIGGSLPDPREIVPRQLPVEQDAGDAVPDDLLPVGDGGRDRRNPLDIIALVDRPASAGIGDATCVIVERRRRLPAQFLAVAPQEIGRASWRERVCQYV